MISDAMRTALDLVVEAGADGISPFTFVERRWPDRRRGGNSARCMGYRRSAGAILSRLVTMGLAYRYDRNGPHFVATPAGKDEATARWRGQAE